MNQTINLIPKEEQKLQQKSQIVKVSTILSVLLLVVVAGVAAYYFYMTNDLNQRLDVENKTTESLRQEISSMSRVEITARNLDKKYSLLKKIFKDRQNFSIALKDLDLRTPENITLDDLSLNPDGTLSASGAGEDYLSISDFVSQLTTKEVPESSKTEKYPELGETHVFKDVTLNSVSLDAQNKSVKYFVVLTYFKEALAIK